MSSEPMDKIRVLGIFPLMLPTAIIYIIKPFSELVKTGKYSFEVVLEPYVTQEHIRWSDVVLFCRNVEPDHRWILDEVIAQGKPCSYDLDDYFWEVPLSAQFGLDLFNPRRIAQLETYLRHVSMVRVFNRRLYDKTSEFNPNVYQALPCIDMRFMPRERPPRDDDRISITYVTGRGAGDELLKIVSDSIARILDCYGDKIKFTFWGEIPPRFQSYPSVELMPILHDYDYFLRELSSGKYDIGLAPMLSTLFYRSKTNTKFRDYGASNIAGIYSNVDIYTQAVRDGVNGLVVENDANSWFDAISRLIEDKNLRESIQRTAYQDVFDQYRQELAEQEWETLIEQMLKKSPSAVADQSLWNGFRNPSKRVMLFGRGNVVGEIVVRVSPVWEPGVSVIADIYGLLPFADSSFSAVIDNQALSASSNLSKTIQEIYRVAEDRSQVCIYEKYTSPSTAEAQMFPQTIFNEDTPRRWTGNMTSMIYEQEYFDRGSPVWGVSTGSEIDLRCNRMEFFYTGHNLFLKNEERRALRRSSDDVCDKVLYHLLVAKTPLDDSENKQMANQMTYLEPFEVTIRRLEDNRRLLFADYERKTRELRELQQKVSESKSDTKQQEIRLLEERLASTETEIRLLEERLASTETEIRSLLFGFQSLVRTMQHTADADPSHFSSEAIDRIRHYPEVDEAVKHLDGLLNQMDELLQQSRGQIQQIASLEQQSEYLSRAGRQTASELGVVRSRKVYWLLRNLFDRSDLRSTLGVAYKQMLDDSLLFNGDIQDYLLQPSEDLQLIRSVVYRFTPGKEGLKSISLLPVADFPASQGTIGMELVHLDLNRVVAHVNVKAAKLRRHAPVHFDFAPLPESGQGVYEIRLYAVDLDSVFRVYEWRKYRMLGLAGFQRQAFLGLEFEQNQ